MLGDQLVAGDVHEEILLQEHLDVGVVASTIDDATGLGGDGAVGDHDARLVAVLVAEGDKLLHLLHTDAARVGDEFDVDRADVDLGVWVGGGWLDGVLLHHIFAGRRGEGHLFTAEREEGH